MRVFISSIALKESYLGAFLLLILQVLEEISCYPENNDAKELKRILTQPHFMVSRSYSVWVIFLIFFMFFMLENFSKFLKSASDGPVYNVPVNKHF